MHNSSVQIRLSHLKAWWWFVRQQNHILVKVSIWDWQLAWPKVGSFGQFLRIIFSPSKDTHPTLRLGLILDFPKNLGIFLPIRYQKISEQSRLLVIANVGESLREDGEMEDTEKVGGNECNCSLGKRCRSVTDCNYVYSSEENRTSDGHK